MEILGSMRLRCFAVTLLMYICNSGIFLCNLSTFKRYMSVPIALTYSSKCIYQGLDKKRID